MEIKKDKCKGCGLCVAFCPTRYLDLSGELNKKGVKFAKVKQGAECVNCGFCFLVCPDNCIKIDYSVESKEQRFESAAQRV